MLNKPPIWWAVGGVLLALTAFGCDAGPPAATPGPPATAPSIQKATLPGALSSEEVAAAVAAGVDVVQWPRRQETPPDNACKESIESLGSEPCIHGDPKATRTMVVYGDSRAGMWVPPLGAIGQQVGWRVEQITFPSCPVPDFPVWDVTLKRRSTECDQFRVAAVDRIMVLHPDLLIIASSSTYLMEKDGRPASQEATDRAWFDGLAAMLARLKPLAGRVAVIGNIPYMARVSLDCLTAHPDDVRVCNTDRSAGVFADHNRMAKSVTEQSGAQYVDTIPWFCTTTVCPVIIAGLDVYRGTHVTWDYSMWLRNVLGIALGLQPAAP